MFTEAFARKMGRDELEITEFLMNAPDKYKVYAIPKRKQGYRIIAQPSRELKHYQRQLQDFIIFPKHKCAMAYRKGLSIKNNALSHVNNSYLLKLDLENFFNSITPDLFWSVWSRTWSLPSKEDQLVLEKLIFWRFQGSLILSVGAPSSPSISNFCMYYFDSEVEAICTKMKITYTRYADDLTFSSNVRNILFEIPVLIENILNEQFKGLLRLNSSKTIFSSKAHNRHVTGITLNNNGKISLGRDRKRYIKHKVHLYTLGMLDATELNHLKGMITFARFIEPAFFKSLETKYNSNVIFRLTQEKI